MVLLKQTKFLNFTLIPSKYLTKLVGVGNNKGEKLAYIKWSPGWRRYVFKPFPETEFDASCMKEICDFINELMAERKA